MGAGRRQILVLVAVMCFAAILPLSRPQASAPLADDPCGAAILTLCRFLPIAPDLEDDVDLTTLSPPHAPPDPNDVMPPTDPCAVGCI
ncbi:hypothetical protein A5722_30495 [Mycobacterium vulneris]|nr:fibronectin-binding protein [Mycobacteriaceae bacterium Msp059]OBK07216.1 hypothetical protein A5637_05595 [Mycolicibacterium fortuitum]OCB47937.1 hypothetical protein A5721_07310 [Mycolicibacterium vulneris]OBK65715.1 hypothetical protein A5654_01730 [Mycolicibacterium fortuitum]OCB51811.1 hypothetical protein A5722_30495 [Mycolicibacterium vulneris]